MGLIWYVWSFVGAEKPSSAIAIAANLFCFHARATTKPWFVLFFIIILIIIIIILFCLTLPYRICSTILNQHIGVLYCKPVWNNHDKFTVQLDFFDLTFTTHSQVANQESWFAWFNDAHRRGRQDGNAWLFCGGALPKSTSNTSASFMTALFSRSAPRINRNDWEMLQRRTPQGSTIVNSMDPLNNERESTLRKT